MKVNNEDDGIVYLDMDFLYDSEINNLTNLEAPNFSVDIEKLLKDINSLYYMNKDLFKIKTICNGLISSIVLNIEKHEFTIEVGKYNGREKILSIQGDDPFRLVNSYLRKEKIRKLLNGY